MIAIRTPEDVNKLQEDCVPYRIMPEAINRIKNNAGIIGHFHYPITIYLL